MARLEIGDVVRTSYGTGPYEIVAIERGCRCVTFLEEHEGITELPEHIHLTLKKTSGEDPHNMFWLNFYDETTLRSVRQPEDHLIVVPTGKLVQATLF